MGWNNPSMSSLSGSIATTIIIIQSHRVILTWRRVTSIIPLTITILLTQKIMIGIIFIAGCRIHLWGMIWCFRGVGVDLSFKWY